MTPRNTRLKYAPSSLNPGTHSTESTSKQLDQLELEVTNIEKEETLWINRLSAVQRVLGINESPDSNSASNQGPPDLPLQEPVQNKNLGNCSKKSPASSKKRIGARKWLKHQKYKMRICEANLEALWEAKSDINRQLSLLRDGSRNTAPPGQELALLNGIWQPSHNPPSDDCSRSGDHALQYSDTSSPVSHCTQPSLLSTSRFPYSPETSTTIVPESLCSDSGILELHPLTCIGPPMTDTELARHLFVYELDPTSPLFYGIPKFQVYDFTGAAHITFRDVQYPQDKWSARGKHTQGKHRIRTDPDIEVKDRFQKLKKCDSTLRLRQSYSLSALDVLAKMP